MTTSLTRLLPLLLLLRLAPTAEAQFTFTTNNGAITITGYTGAGGVVVIPSSTNDLPVTTIGDDAFFSCTNLTAVTIPDSVTSIGLDAFLFCVSLTAITVDTNNAGYSSLDGVLFNKGQTTLVEYPSGKVGNYIIPNSVNMIGTNAFSVCNSLTSVSIPSNVTYIADGAFDGCNGLTNVTIPGSVTSIGRTAFFNCAELTTASLGNGVTNLGNFAFANCASLTTVTIGKNLRLIGLGALQYSTSLVAVYFQGNHPGGNAYPLTGDNNATVYYLPGATGWGTTFSGRPAVLWNPTIRASDASFGVQTNRFGFRVTGTANIPIAAEACTDLAIGSWTCLQTCTLTNGSVYFSDPGWTNYPARFYRIRSP